MKLKYLVYNLHNYAVHFKCIIIWEMLKMFGFLLPINQKKVFCVSMQGGSKGCNIEPIVSYLKAKDDGFYFIWAFKKSTYNKYHICTTSTNSVRVNTWNYYYHLYTSKFILSNDRMVFLLFPSKRKGQFYLQTWHGTALKKIEADMPGDTTDYRRIVEPDSKKIDCIISGSNYMTNLYKNSFWYNGRVEETGTPRNDIFFKKDSDIKNKIKNQFNIDENCKIILYAPTFRNVEIPFSLYFIDLDKFLKSITSSLHGEWRVMVRLHPDILTPQNISNLKQLCSTAIDVSFYPDMQELLYCADILVTDYSSSMFDFMYSLKPCFMYISDYQSYDRGFYMSIHDLPFPKIMSNSNIDDVVKFFDYTEYVKNVKSFMISIGSKEDGHAAERCGDLFFN